MAREDQGCALILVGSIMFVTGAIVAASFTFNLFSTAAIEKCVANPQWCAIEHPRLYEALHRAGDPSPPQQKDAD